MRPYASVASSNRHGKPKIVPEQAEVIRRIYESCLAGQSLRMIKDTLESEGIPNVKGVELLPSDGSGASLGDLDRMIAAQEKKFGELFASVQSNQDFMARADEFKAINDELAALKSRKAMLLERQSKDAAANWRVDEAVELLESGTSAAARWPSS